MPQIAQSHCGASAHPPVYCPKKTAIALRTLSRGIWLSYLQRSFPKPSILWFSYSFSEEFITFFYYYYFLKSKNPKAMTPPDQWHLSGGLYIGNKNKHSLVHSLFLLFYPVKTFILIPDKEKLCETKYFQGLRMKMLAGLLTASEIFFLTNLHNIENMLSPGIEHNNWRTLRLSCLS